MAFSISAGLRGAARGAAGYLKGTAQGEREALDEKQKRRELEMAALESYLMQTNLSDLSRKRQAAEDEETALRGLQESDPRFKGLSRSAIETIRINEAKPATTSQDWDVDLPRGQRVNRRTGEVQPLMSGGKPVGPQPTPQQGRQPVMQEREAAGFALEMKRGIDGMDAIERSDPRAVQEALAFLQAGRTAGSLPGVGKTLEEAIKGLRAKGLSEAAIQYITHANSFLATALPERGGKALTLAEIGLYLPSYVGLPGETPDVIETKRKNRQGRFEAAKFKSAGQFDELVKSMGGDSTQTAKPRRSPDEHLRRLGGGS